MCRITLTGNFCAVPTECVKLAPELHTCFSKRFWWAITHSQRKTYSSFTWYLRFPVFTHLFGIFCHQFSKCVVLWQLWMITTIVNFATIVIKSHVQVNFNLSSIKIYTKKLNFIFSHCHIILKSFHPIPSLAYLIKIF